MSAVALPLVLKGGGVGVHLAGGADGLVVILGVNALTNGRCAPVHQRGLGPGAPPPALAALHPLGAARALLVSDDLVTLDQGRVGGPEIPCKASHLFLTKAGVTQRRDVSPGGRGLMLLLHHGHGRLVTGGGLRAALMGHGGGHIPRGLLLDRPA